jgi:hypothetical protein
VIAPSCVGSGDLRSSPRRGSREGLPPVCGHAVPSVVDSVVLVEVALPLARHLAKNPVVRVAHEPAPPGSGTGSATPTASCGQHRWVISAIPPRSCPVGRGGRPDRPHSSRGCLVDRSKAGAAPARTRVERARSRGSYSSALHRAGGTARAAQMVSSTVVRPSRRRLAGEAAALTQPAHDFTVTQFAALTRHVVVFPAGHGSQPPVPRLGFRAAGEGNAQLAITHDWRIPRLGRAAP